MDWLIEILFECFGEFILQFFFEALAQAGIHFFRNPDCEHRDQNPLVLVLGYAIFGSICGGVSLLLFPHYLVRLHVAKLAYLVLAPAAASLAIVAIGIWRSRYGRARVGIDRLGYGYVFAFTFALVRFFFASYAG